MFEVTKYSLSNKKNLLEKTQKIAIPKINNIIENDDRGPAYSDIKYYVFDKILKYKDVDSAVAIVNDSKMIREDKTDLVILLLDSFPENEREDALKRFDLDKLNKLNPSPVYLTDMSRSSYGEITVLNEPIQLSDKTYKLFLDYNFIDINKDIKLYVGVTAKKSLLDDSKGPNRVSVGLSIDPMVLLNDTKKEILLNHGYDAAKKFAYLKTRHINEEKITREVFEAKSLKLTYDEFKSLSKEQQETLLPTLDIKILKDNQITTKETTLQQ